MLIQSLLAQTRETMTSVMSPFRSRLAEYTSPDWVGWISDGAAILGFLLAAAGVVAIITKAVRWADKRKDDRLAQQVKEIVQPIIQEATQSIQPGYRNGGHSLADVAEMGKANAADLQVLAAKGERRDATIDRMVVTLDAIDARSQKIEQRQAEGDARAERIEEAARKVADETARHHEAVRGNTTALWNAVRELGATIPEHPIEEKS